MHTWVHRRREKESRLGDSDGEQGTERKWASHGRICLPEEGEPRDSQDKVSHRSGHQKIGDEHNTSLSSSKDILRMREADLQERMVEWKVLFGRHGLIVSIEKTELSWVGHLCRAVCVVAARIRTSARETKLGRMHPGKCKG